MVPMQNISAGTKLHRFNFCEGILPLATCKGLLITLDMIHLVNCSHDIFYHCCCTQFFPVSTLLGPMPSLFIVWIFLFQKNGTVWKLRLIIFQSALDLRFISFLSGMQFLNVSRR